MILCTATFLLLGLRFSHPHMRGVTSGVFRTRIFESLNVLHVGQDWRVWEFEKFGEWKVWSLKVWEFRVWKWARVWSLKVWRGIQLWSLKPRQCTLHEEARRRFTEQPSGSSLKVWELGVWKFETQEVWKFENLEVWKFEKFQTLGGWKLAVFKLRKFESLKALEFECLRCSKFEGLRVWRFVSWKSLKIECIESLSLKPCWRPHFRAWAA